MKNRTTIKPTPKSLFNDFNTRRGIAISNYNSMVNDGDSSVLSTKERTNFLLIRDRAVCPVVYAAEIIDAYVTEIYQLSCRLFAPSSATAVHENNRIFVGKI